MTREAIFARACGTPYYRQLAGRDWAGVPLTRRDELVRDQVEHLPFGRRRLGDAGRPVRVGISGSGDDLLILPWSEHDLALERRAGRRALVRLGIAPGTAIANTLPGALVSPGSLLFGDVVEEHGGLDVPLGAVDSDAAAKAAWELVDRVTPGILCLEVATAARFFAAAPALSRPWLNGIVWLRRAPSPTAVPAVPAAVGFGGWQRSWLTVPEAASFVAVTCAADAMHADEDVLVEVERETLVLTPRAGGSALLRYDTGLGGRFLSAPCGCGAQEGFTFTLVAG